MDAIDGKAKVVIPRNVTSNVIYGSNNNDNINGMKDSINNERSKATRNGEIIVLKTIPKKE